MVIKDVQKNVMRLGASLKRIQTYTKDFHYEDFADNRLVIDACLMQLIVIGDMIAKIRSTFPQLYKQLPSQQAIGLRNIIAHTYHKVDPEEIRNIITYDLPKLQQALDDYKGMI